MARITTQAAKLRIVPANKVSWDDLLAVVGTARCHGDPCFCQRFKIMLTRIPYRWQGFTYQMIAAAVEFASEGGAHAVEGYGMLTEPGKKITWGELHVGSRNAFAAAGLREVTRPTKRRAVMRIDL